MAVPTSTKKTSKLALQYLRNQNSFITFNREVIGIRRETTENYLGFVYNTELRIFIFNNNSSLWILSNFSEHGSKSEHQGHFKPSIEDKTLTYKLISLKQLDNSYGKHKSLHATKGVFTWHRGDFRAGVTSLRFPLIALHLFTWYHHKMSCRRESPRREFTPVLSPGREFHCRYVTSQRYHVNAKRPLVSVWNRFASRLERVAHA